MSHTRTRLSCCDATPETKPTSRTRNGSLGPPSVCVRGLILGLELVWGSLRWIGVQNRCFSWFWACERHVRYHPRIHIAVSGAWHVHMGVAQKSGYPICGARIRVGVVGSCVWAAVAVVTLLRRFALCFRTLDGPEQQGFSTGRLINGISYLC
jgi:hypothetical protein